MLWILVTSFTGCRESYGFPFQSGWSHTVYVRNAAEEVFPSASVGTEGNLTVEKLICENGALKQCSDDTYLVAGLLGALLFMSTISLLYYVWRIKGGSSRKSFKKTDDNILDGVSLDCSMVLTLIRELSGQLRDNQVDREVAEIYLDNIIRQSEGLLRLLSVPSVLDQALWKRGDVAAYILMLIGRFQLYAHQKEIELNYVPSGTNIVMDFVPDNLCRIMENLLFYGIRYTGRGEKIHLTTEEKAGMLILKMTVPGKVVRTGSTFLSRSCSLIDTDSFFMEAGVGIKRASRLAEYMGGTVTVEDASLGITVCVVLPLKHGDTHWESWTLEQSESGWVPFEGLWKEVAGIDGGEPCRRPSILLVNVEGVFPLYIGDLLKNGYHLLCVSDMLDALAKTRTFMPDLVILDEVSGKNDELYNDIGYSDILARIPVVGIKADKTKAGYYWVAAKGMDAWSGKPFDTDGLLACITVMLKRQQPQEDIFDHVMEDNTGCQVDLSPADRSFMERLNTIICARMSDSNLNLVFVAEKMGMSRSQINRRIRAITGNSTMGYILQLRMEKAELLLASTDLSIGDVAVQCGFDDAGYFTRVFKQSFHAPPSLYRRKVHR